VSIEVHTADERPEDEKVTRMPRTLQEIVDHADELSAAFDAIEPDPGAGRDPAPLLQARTAVQARARAEADVANAAAAMRAAGYSWRAIGAVVGTSGEAARQRYGGGQPPESTPTPTPRPRRATAATPARVRTVRSRTAKAVTGSAITGRTVAAKSAATGRSLAKKQG
jgi:hypothetical protein